MRRKEIKKIASGEYGFSVNKVFDYLHSSTGECTISIFSDIGILEKCEINHLVSMNLIEENLFKTVDGFKFREEQGNHVLAGKIANRAWNKCGVKIEYNYHNSSKCIEFRTVPLRPVDCGFGDIIRICGVFLSISKGEG